MLIMVPFLALKTHLSLLSITVALLVLGFVQINHGQYCAPGTKIQIAIIQDRTYTFSPFIKEFARATTEIVDAIQRDFPDAQFAYTAFADYDVNLKKQFCRRRDTHPVNPRTSCYEMIQPFTSDRQVFVNKIRQFASLTPAWLFERLPHFHPIYFINGAYDGPESSMTAILYTISDLWSNNLWYERASDNRDVKKVVILITDEDTVGPKDAPFLMFKPKPHGKGDCVSQSFPCVATVANIMQKEDITIIGLLAPNTRNHIDMRAGFYPIDIVATWKKHFNDLRVPYYIELLQDSSAAKTIVSVVTRSVKKISCEMPPARPPPPPPPLPPPPPPPIQVARVDEEEKVQIVFVMDRTQDLSAFIQQFAEKAKNFVLTFKKLFKRVEFGITAFADFPLHVKKGGNPQKVTLGLNIDNSLRCYERILPLTVDGKLFLEKLKEFSQLKWVNGFDPPESSMTGLLYTAADKEMNWSTSEISTKIIVLITDEDTCGKKDAPELLTKPKPKGDGMDTCTEHSFPDISTVKTVLQNGRFELLGLLAPKIKRMKGWPRIKTREIWRNYFREIGVNFYIERLKNTKGKDRIALKIVRGIKVIRKLITAPNEDSVEDEDDQEEAGSEEVKPKRKQKKGRRKQKQDDDEDDDGNSKKKGNKSKKRKKPNKDQTDEAPVSEEARSEDGTLQPTKLQIAFVIERRTSFHSFLKGFIEKSEELLKGLRKLTKGSTFNETEFGFAAFDDFALAIKNGQRTTSPLKRISCYELICPLTRDESRFRDKVAEFMEVEWTNVAPDPPQSSLTALMYTAADFRMKWDKTNENVKKVIVLITNEETVTRVDAPGLLNKPKPTGDGHDTCTDHSFADPKLVASLITSGGFSVIALIGPNQRAEDSEEYQVIDSWATWDKYFSVMGIEYMMYPIPIQNSDSKANKRKQIQQEVDSIEDSESRVEAEAMEEVVTETQEYAYYEWFEEVTYATVDALVVNTDATTISELTSASGEKRDCTGLTKLQIVFVQDRSPDFTLFIQQLTMMAKSIAVGIQGIFPIVEIGLTTFSDFHPRLKDGSVTKTNMDKRTSCYEVMQPLTSEPATLTKALEIFANLQEIDDGGDEAQSSMTALLYTAADKSLSWASAEDTGVKKVIVLITNADTVGEDDGPVLANKPKPEGSGADTCIKNSFPDIETVGEVLKNGNINVLALLPPSKQKGTDIVKIWKNHLEQLGVNYNIEALESTNVPGGITRRIVAAVKAIVCKEAGPVSEGDLDADEDNNEKEMAYFFDS